MFDPDKVTLEGTDSKKSPKKGVKGMEKYDFISTLVDRHQEEIRMRLMQTRSTLLAQAEGKENIHIQNLISDEMIDKLCLILPLKEEQFFKNKMVQIADQHVGLL